MHFGSIFTQCLSQMSSQKSYFFQKFGSCCNLLSKLLYHCWRQEKGTKVSPDLDMFISPPLTAKLVAKLNKFSTIFCPNSMNVDTLTASVWAAGVWASMVARGSTEIPTMALVLGLESPPRAMKLFVMFKFSSEVFNLDILKKTNLCIILHRFNRPIPT